MDRSSLSKTVDSQPPSINQESVTVDSTNSESWSQYKSPQLNNWFGGRTIHDRLAAYSLPLPGDLPQSKFDSPCSQPIRSGSSMVHTRLHHPISWNGSVHAPSLVYSEETPTESSISTGRASRLSGFHLLEDVDGVSEVSPNDRTPIYECAFWFLSCSYISQDKDEWQAHCMSHFQGENPPRNVQCPLCETFEATYEDGRDAWNSRMEHVAIHHELGHTLKASRPDYHLFQYLWQKRLIDDADLKELTGDDRSLTTPPQPLRATVRRGRRESRRHRPTVPDTIISDQLLHSKTSTASEKSTLTSSVMESTKESVSHVQPSHTTSWSEQATGGPLLSITASNPQGFKETKTMRRIRTAAMMNHLQKKEDQTVFVDHERYKRSKTVGKDAEETGFFGNDIALRTFGGTPAVGKPAVINPSREKPKLLDSTSPELLCVQSVEDSQVVKSSKSSKQSASSKDSVMQLERDDKPQTVTTATSITKMNSYRERSQSPSPIDSTFNNLHLVAPEDPISLAYLDSQESSDSHEVAAVQQSGTILERRVNQEQHFQHIEPGKRGNKPRLTKEQPDVLEEHFQKQQKPSTSTKKDSAEVLNIPLDKLYNWFQNRRAKTKQDPKKRRSQMDLDMGTIARNPLPTSTAIGTLYTKHQDNFEGSSGLKPLESRVSLLSSYDRNMLRHAPILEKERERSYVDNINAVMQSLVAAAAGSNVHEGSEESEDVEIENEVNPEIKLSDLGLPPPPSPIARISSISNPGKDSAMESAHCLSDKNSTGRMYERMCASDEDGSSSVVTTSSSATEEEEEAIVFHSIKKKQETLDRLMRYFYSKFDPYAHGIRSCAGFVSRNKCAGSDSSRETTQSSSGSATKRQRTDSDLGSQKGDGDDSNDGLPPTGKFAAGGFEPGRRLACPYFKRDPQQYQRMTSCPGPGWDSVHRVKEHLYRKHLSIQCPRCYKQIKTAEELRSHQRSPEGCQVRDSIPAEGLNEEQAKKLRSRKRLGPDRSEADKWREVYFILFPNDDRSSIPTPYYEYGVAQYEEYLERELPRYVRRRLEEALDEQLEPIEEGLKAQIVKIVEMGQEELSRNYHSSIPASSSKNQTIVLPELGRPPSPEQQSSSSPTLVRSIDLFEGPAGFSITPHSNDDLWQEPSHQDCMAPREVGGLNEVDSGYNSLDSEEKRWPNTNESSLQGDIDWSNLEVDLLMLGSSPVWPENWMVETCESGQINLQQSAATQEARICNCKGKGKSKADEHQCTTSQQWDDS